MVFTVVNTIQNFIQNLFTFQTHKVPEPISDDDEPTPPAQEYAELFKKFNTPTDEKSNLTIYYLYKTILNIQYVKNSELLIPTPKLDVPVNNKFFTKDFIAILSLTFQNGHNSTSNSTIDTDKKHYQKTYPKKYNTGSNINQHITTNNQTNVTPTLNNYNTINILREHKWYFKHNNVSNDFVTNANLITNTKQFTGAYNHHNTQAMCNI